MTEETKECQMCHQVFPKDSFYKRKDRNGEYTWILSYCNSCEINRSKQFKKKDPEKHRLTCNCRSNKYYNENKDKYKIYHKRSYFRKLSPEKKIKYKIMIMKKYPEIADQIF